MNGSMFPCTHTCMRTATIQQLQQLRNSHSLCQCGISLTFLFTQTHLHTLEEIVRMCKQLQPFPSSSLQTWKERMQLPSHSSKSPMGIAMHRS